MGQRAEDTHRRLIAAAGELFYEEGIRASGIEAIAGHAGVTKMTLYAHFGSKDELVAAYLEERDRRWWEYLDEALERYETPEERLLAVFDAYRDWLVSGRLRGCGFVNFSAELPDREHPGRTVVERHKAGVRGLLADLVSGLGSEEPGELAEHLFFILEGAYVTGALEGDERGIGRARLLAESLIEDRPGPRLG
ncbi:TetR/AcrR family transcriptional regulator [Rubrobacter aplysinae]|uniref:TetR/AcrR family transcriptional regulator n=1 Tax=Rubrobacter aplysinae TaxID=909625 RepID=UPI00064C1D1C|nr:TetR/AcrR family transcriptional regulator [Rubrobacter aplysinae]